MATTNAPTTILLVSKNPSVIESTHTVLANDANLILSDEEVTSKTLFNVISEFQPDVILYDFDFQDKPFSMVDKIASEYPMSAVVAILSESQAINLDRVILSGARAFIFYPYQPGKLVITIRRINELLERSQPRLSSAPAKMSTEKPKKIITVFSPKGGVGTTTIATNLAISLLKDVKQDVLLIDGKHLFGHVALYLNLLTANSITDLIAHAGMLDEQLIKQVVERHKSGIHVLPSPKSISEAQGIRPENLFTVIQGLQQLFPDIIIDGGNHLDDNTVTYMDSSDRILLVINPDLASMRDARQFMEISAGLSYPKEKTLLILNLAGRKADVKVDEIENILKKKIFGKIPADENLALSCINEGVPILQKKPRHPISRALRQISKELISNLQTLKTE